MSAPDRPGLDPTTRSGLTVAAIRATRRHPGPAGTVLARADFGFRALS